MGSGSGSRTRGTRGPSRSRSAPGAASTGCACRPTVPPASAARRWPCRATSRCGRAGSLFDPRSERPAVGLLEVVSLLEERGEVFPPAGRDQCPAVVVLGELAVLGRDAARLVDRGARDLQGHPLLKRGACHHSFAAISAFGS